MSSSCPSCGAGVAFPSLGSPLVECRHCGALVVRLPSGAASEAVPFRGEASVPIPGRLVALICRLCGGPWPFEERAPRPADRCGYCGHPASGTPTVLAALRLLVRHPTRAPAPLRHLGAFWLPALVAVLLVLGLGLLRPARGVSHQETLALPAGLASGPSVVALELRSSLIHVGPRARGFPYVSVSAHDLARGRLCVLATLRHVGSGKAVSGWLTLWDGEPPRPGYPEHHTWGELGLSGSGRIHPLPWGDYRVELSALVFQGSAPPAALTIEVRTMAEPAIGFLVLLFNALPWLLIVDLRANAGRLTGAAPRSSRVARGLFLLVLAGVLLEQVRPQNPFGTKGALVERSAEPTPPSACGAAANGGE